MTISTAKQEKLAAHYTSGSTQAAAARAVGVAEVTATKYFRRFADLGMVRGEVKRGRRRQRMRDLAPPAYLGPAWIGLPIGEPPVPEGPGWAGRRAVTIQWP